MNVENIPRILQYMQIDFIKMWKFIEEEKLLGVVRRKDTPLSKIIEGWSYTRKAEHTEQRLLWLFKRTIGKMFPKPTFDIVKARDVFEYTIFIQDVNFRTKFYSVLNSRPQTYEQSIVDACRSLITLNEEEVGVLSIRNIGYNPYNFIISMDKKAGSYRYRRNKYHRYNTQNGEPEFDFYNSIKVLVSWNKRLTSVLNILKTAQEKDQIVRVEEPKEPVILSAHQEQFNIAIQSLRNGNTNE